MDENRFYDFYDRAMSRWENTFSPFLNLDEQSILQGTHLNCITFGGYNNSERVVAGFGEYVEKSDFPIVCLKISPLAQKFADTLSHRDFLGALMNLGIKREFLGDIIIDDNCAYLFCLEQISEYITDNLNRVKHTSVKVETANGLPDRVNELPEVSEYLVASLRLDVLVSAVYSLSRNKSLELFEAQKVFVNSRQIDNSSYMLKENDVVSVRGFGRFIYKSLARTTKKGKSVVEIIKL